MTDIDISPEAAERLATVYEGKNDGTVHGGFCGHTADVFRALSAALTQSRANEAAAYEAAAQVAETLLNESSSGDDDFDDGWDAAINAAIPLVRALTTADAKSALDRMIEEAKAEALSGPWKDKPDALTDAVHAAHPVFTKDYKTYTEALELVSNRHGKGALVGLVNYLMVQNKTAEARGMREAAEIARQALVDGAYIKRGSHQETPSSVMFLAETLVSNAILAAIPQGDTTND